MINMKLREIVLGEDEDSRRRAIQENFGKEVIIRDFHKEWMHGTLLDREYNREVYKIELQGEGRQIRLHYHDLDQLLLVSNYRT